MLTLGAAIFFSTSAGAHTGGDLGWLFSQSNSKYLGIYNITDYFQSSANYLSGGGTYADLANDGAMKVINSDFFVFYKPTSAWTLKAGLQYANTQSRGNGYTRTNSGLSQMRLVASRDFLIKKRWRLTPELSLTIPTKRADIYSDEVLLGEGATEAQGLLRSSWIFNSFVPFAFVGVNGRDQERSSEFIWGAGGELPFFKVHRLGAEIFGNTNLTKDPNDTVERSSFITKVQGGSFKYLTPNARTLQTQLWYRYTGRSLDILGGLGSTLNGENSAAGLNFTAGLSWSWNRLGSSTPIYRGNINQDDSNSSRSGRPGKRPDNVYQDKYNFEGESASHFQYNEPPDLSDLPPPKRKPKTTQQQLNEVEIQLEEGLDDSFR